MVDFLLLSDIFLKFIDVCLKKYGFDAAAFYTAHCLSFSAALRLMILTNVRLQLLHDTDIVLLWEMVFGVELRNYL